MTHKYKVGDVVTVKENPQHCKGINIVPGMFVYFGKKATITKIANWLSPAYKINNSEYFWSEDHFCNKMDQFIKNLKTT